MAIWPCQCWRGGIFGAHGHATRCSTGRRCWRNDISARREVDPRAEQIELHRGIATVGTVVMVRRADRPWPALGQGLAGCRPAAGANPPAGAACVRPLHGHPATVRTGGLPCGPARAQGHFGPDRTTALLPADAATVNEVIRAAAELQSVCEREGWRSSRPAAGGTGHRRRAFGLRIRVFTAAST